MGALDDGLATVYWATYKGRGGTGQESWTSPQQRSVVLQKQKRRVPSAEGVELVVYYLILAKPSAFSDVAPSINDLVWLPEADFTKQAQALRVKDVDEVEVGASAGASYALDHYEIEVM